MTDEELTVWDLDRIHKIGELAASVAIVITLLFVGFEVQQNNKLQRQVATRSMVRDWSDTVVAWQDPQLACLWVRLMTDNVNLTLQEITQVETVYWRIYKVYEEIHYQNEEGMIDESVWGGFRTTTALAASSQGFRDWWQGYRVTFSTRFQKYMDGLFAATPVNPKPYYLGMTCDSPIGDGYFRSEEVAADQE